MEESKSFVIPTRFKGKISHDLSFPVGAEKISTALSETAQFRKIVLHFNSDRWHLVRHGNYRVLQVQHSSRYALFAEQAINEGREPLWGEWQIDVSPVPRVLRHKIQGYLLDTAIPRVRLWLQERSSLTRRGEDVMAFFYDETKEEFTVECETRPEPLRA